MSERAAGRELNIDVAERVFGEVEANAPCGDGLTRTATFIGKTLADCDAQILLAYPQAIANGMKLWPAQYIGPDYSGDIAAAWLVVGQMADRVSYFAIEQRSFVTRQWHAHFDFEEDSAGDSAPHAVCLAALAWVSSSSGQGAE